MRRRSFVVVLLTAVLAVSAMARPVRRAIPIIVHDTPPSNLRATVNSPTSVTVTWNAVAGALTYEVLRSTGGVPVVIGTASGTTFTDATASANTTYRYFARATGGTNSAPVYAGTFSFTDDPIVVPSTKTKVAHITELRTDVNAMRVFGGLSAATFTDPSLTTSTPIRAVHLTELRTALNAARTALSMATIAFTDSSIIAGTTAIKAAHVRELRGGVRQASTTGALLNGPPVFTSSTTPSIAENTTAVMTVTTTDPEANARSYSIFGGVDAAKFSIHPTSGALAFLVAPDFESPTDSGTNNVYDVIVSASDGQGNVAAIAIAVTVTNASDGVSFTSSNAVSVTEQAEGVFHTVTATDGANTITYAITGGADQGDLSITSGGGLSFNAPPDFFAPVDSDTNNVYVVEVTASSSGGGSNIQTLSVTVTQMTCVSLALGGVHTSTTPVPKTFCLSGVAEYTIVPTNVSSASAIGVNLTGTGIVAVTGPPSPLTGIITETEDSAFEWKLRTRERDEIHERMERERLSPHERPRFRTDAITPGVPSVGTLMDLNVETDNTCSTNDLRKARVEVVGTHIIIMQEVNSGTFQPVIANGLNTSDYQEIANEFDNVIWPAVTAAFGTPADIDSNSRVIAFYTSAVNQLTPPASSSFVDGFFFSRDLSSAAGCATSNVGEMIYTLMADPTGSINGNARSVSFVKETTKRTLAHELEHLINASRRMYVNTPFVALEEVWLDEALAHISEELVFFEAASLSPRANLGVAAVGAAIDQFFQYEEPNFAKLRQWLLSPHTSGLAQGDNDDATRGQAYAFLRYASDRKGGTETAFWQGLVNTQQTGLTNLQTNLGTDPAPWFADFAMTTYSDDATTGVPSTFAHASWNFREIFQNLDYNPGPACSCAYELATRNPSNGVTDSFSLTTRGSSAYWRVGVSGTRAMIKARANDNGALPSDVQVRVFRRE
jgi:hypothetical protein